MKQSLNTDTLAYQIGMRPAFMHLNMEDARLKSIVADMTKAMSSKTDLYALTGDFETLAEPMTGSPEKDALMFYMLNHASTLVRQRCHVYQPLGKYLPIMTRYGMEVSIRATRMFWYLLLICTRESRHDHQDKGGSKYTALTAKYGPAITNFHKSLKGMGSLQAAAQFQSSCPDTDIGSYTKFLSEVFYGGQFGGGYGGPAWGKVSDVLRDFVHGTITAEMMMDTAFTLCHNNGPIFNKGMLFSNYSNEIYKILDVQRSGQIPKLIAEGYGLAGDSSVKAAWSSCAKVIGDEFDGYVDWFLVEELGALKSYPDQKTKQIAKYGYPSTFKAKKEAEAAKQEAVAKAALSELKSKIEVFPGYFIKKTKRPV